MINKEKEIALKYKETSYNYKNYGYTTFAGVTKTGETVLSLINIEILKWDKKASHKWLFFLIIPFESKENNLPDDKTEMLLNELEEEIILALPNSEGYVNIGHEISKNKKEIFFACKDFRKPAKTEDELIKKYSGIFAINYEIYKDKYWQSFNQFEQN